MRWPAINHKHRKGRQDITAFDALVETPSVGAFPMPARARLGFRRASVVAAGTTAATLTGPTNRTIKTPALVANEVMVLDGVERGTVVTPAFGFEVVIDVGLGKFVKIAEGA